MEDLLKEILYELKKINHSLDLECLDGASNLIELKIKLGEDVIAEKVINKQSRLNVRTTIVV